MKSFFRILVLLLATDQALADGYSKFYRSNPSAPPDVIARYREAPPPETPQLMQVSDSPQDVVNAMARKGYLPIGYSSFTSGWPAKPKGALKQGKKVTADLVVVIDPRYERTVSNSIPITTPTTSTTYHSGNATAYGAGGTVTAFGSGTSTTYGSQTTYIPYSIDRYEYGAVYFVKRRYSFGVNVRPLDDFERQRLQTNSGVVVTVVVEGSPAFSADVLLGDIITRFNNEAVTTPEHFTELTIAYAKQQIEVVLIRGDQLIKKIVQLK